MLKSFLIQIIKNGLPEIVSKDVFLDKDFPRNEWLQSGRSVDIEDLEELAHMFYYDEIYSTNILHQLFGTSPSTSFLERCFDCIFCNGLRRVERLNSLVLAFGKLWLDKDKAWKIAFSRWGSHQGMEEIAEWLGKNVGLPTSIPKHSRISIDNIEWYYTAGIEYATKMIEVAKQHIEKGE